MRPTRLTLTALCLLLVELLAAVYSGIYGLVSCLPTCDYQDPTGLRLVFHPGGTAIFPPFVLVFLLIISILLGMHPGRRGFPAVLYLAAYGAFTIPALLAEPIAFWSLAGDGIIKASLTAPYPSTIQAQIAVIVILSFAGSGGTLALALWELATRLRHGLRRPASPLLAA